MSETPHDHQEPLAAMVADVPHVDEYFGVWCVEPQRFMLAVDQVLHIDLRSHLTSQRAPEAMEARRDTGYAVLPGGVAVIDLSGPMQKYTSSLSGGTSTVYARRKIRAAIADDQVAAIVLRIDSPGGTAAGTQDLADDVAAAARRKPTIAYIEDMGASAAYWTASQATAVWANRTGLVGSIGTFAVIHDLSAHAGQLGVKVHVVKAGAMKGAGVPGTEITETQLAEWQRVVDGLNEHFLKAVSQGRKMPLAAVKDIADGRVHLGEYAMRLGLVDRVGSFDQAVAEARKQVRSNAGNITAAAPPQPVSEELVMSETETKQPTAASYEDLKACLPGASSDFICEQLDRKATIDQATSAWMERQQAEIDRLRQQTAARPQAAGVEPMPQQIAAEQETADAGTQFAELVAQEMQQRRCSRAMATRRVAAKHPDLREAWVAEHNQNHRRA